jgi:ATP/ADP translocase
LVRHNNYTFYKYFISFINLPIYWNGGGVMEALTEEQVRLTIVGIFIVCFVLAARVIQYLEIKHKRKKKLAKLAEDSLSTEHQCQVK